MTESELSDILCDSVRFFERIIPMEGESKMDVDGLNRKLYRLTPSELRHRESDSYSWGHILKRDQRASSMVLLLGGFPETLSEDSPSADKGMGEIYPGVYLTAGGAVMVRRNSRFNAVPEHRHDHIEMSYVYTGTCPQVVNGAPLELQENEVLLLDTDCPHAIGALGEGDIMISFVITDRTFLYDVLDSIAKESALSRFLLESFSAESDHERCMHFPSRDNRRLRRFFQELLCETYDPSTNAAYISRGLMQLIFAELMNVYESAFAHQERERGAVSVVPIVHYIEKNFRTCTQESVARHFSISSKYVSMLLKRHTGMTYRQMVQTQKLAWAASLLRSSNLSIVDVAREVGYENMTFFYRKFAERYGCSPREYRDHRVQ